MKALLVSLIMGAASFAFAESDRMMCEPGSTAVFGGKTYVCSYTGMGWEDPNRGPIRCKEGRVAWLPVHGQYQGENELTARAVCRNGKYIFDNDAYNYRPTRGTARCQEGRIWIEGQDRGFEGITYQCQNGRAVRIR